MQAPFMQKGGLHLPLRKTPLYQLNDAFPSIDFNTSYLLEHGTSKQVAADLLGHADTAFLERTYCHPQDICKEEAAGLFDSLLAPTEEEYCDTLQD